jgi:Tfp pilus assembly protein PilF
MTATMKNIVGSSGCNIALIVLLTIAAYMPAMRAGFIWDDDDHLTANPAMTAPDGLRRIWSSLAVSRYYPLTLTSFWLQRRLWGLNPFPYHWVNIALHAANGVLVFLLLRRLRIPAAWLAAGLWMVHPVNVESVAWITELKNTQSGLFFFGALLLFLQFEERKQNRWYALALVSGACAILSKPSTVVLPAVLLLCIWWERGRWPRLDLLRIMPFFILALAMSALTIVEQRWNITRAGTAEWKAGIAERFIIAGKAVWFYAAKLLWPAKLVFVYPRWEVTPNSLWDWLPLASATASGIALWTWRRQPWARAGLFGLGFFVTALLPVLGFFDVFYFRYSFVADHFQYLASLGIIASVSCAVVRSRRGTVIGYTLALALAGLTWRQARVYRDAETVWRDTVRKNPGAWMAHNNLGKCLTDAGKFDEAIARIEQALRIKPDHAPAHNNLGLALQKTGRLRDAISHYEQALRLEPGHVEALSNLGVALAGMGAEREAVEHYERALQLRPDSALLRYNYGNALFRAGRIDQAIRQYEQAVRINPDFVQAHYNWAIALEQAGQPKEAIAHYEQALRLKPDFAEAQQALARLRAP